MRGFSKAIIAGNLSRDPEMRATPTGSQACGFTIAVNRGFRGTDGSLQETVSFLDCTAWGKTGETINQYMHKGSAILVSGRLEQRSWDDKTTGQKRSKVEIVVDDFNFISGGGPADGGVADSSYSGGSAGAGSAKSKKSSGSTGDDFGGEITPDDVPDDQIDLDEIPF